MRRTVSRLRDASTPVTECGYRKSARAEPNASVEYPSACGSARSVLSVGDSEAANFLSAALKIASKPWSLIGM